ncbi:alkaline phosphatase family protein, partial [uncultured Clostridium sp.]|uniref:alkaline phosphatase family protein n=1 Tax=uncultured Clostridium sp. TaxID=59620 RepID=UPI0025F2CF8E
KEGALIKNVESIYPSLTYPAHATIVTGKYPKNHGIINNTVRDFNSDNPEWYWYRKSIKGDTIYDIAEKNGLKTCSILWPISGRSKITYNMPEICCTRSYENQIIKSALAGSLVYQIKMNKRFGYLRQGIKQPYLDNFAMEVAKKTIREEKPNLLLLHLVDVDSQKHIYGSKSKEVRKALERHDKRLGEIIEVLKFSGIYNESTIIALGDHSQLDPNFTRADEVMANRESRVFNECKEVVAAGTTEGRVNIESDAHAEMMIEVAQSIAYNQNRRYIIITENNGAINNMQDDAMVEVVAELGINGPRPMGVGNIPQFYLGLLVNQVSCEKLLIDAYYEESYSKALQAFTLNRLINDGKKARKVLDALIEANKEYWPELK